MVVIVVVLVDGRNEIGERDFMLRPDTMFEIEVLAVEVSGMRWLSGWHAVVLRFRASFGLMLVVVVLFVVRLKRFCWAGGCFRVVVDVGLMDVSDCLFMIVARFELLQEFEI